MNTSLIQTKVWLPIYKVESAIHYQSIRKPTAFEALILKLAICNGLMKSDSEIEI